MKKTKSLSYLFKKIGVSFIILGLFFNVILVNMVNAAGVFTNASLSISDSRPSQTATYLFGFTTSVTTAIKQLDIQICTTATGTCTAPGAFASGTPTIGGTDNIAGTGRTTTAPTSNAFRVVVTTPTTQSTQAVTINFTGVTNPNTASTFYARITTYSDTGSTVIDGTTSIAYATTTGVATSVTVDPSLTFTVNTVASGQTVNGGTTTVASTSTTVPFGSVSTSSNGIAAQSLVVTTNAANGYTVYTHYTGQLSDGNGHTIANHGGTNASPTVFSAAGTSAFGYTTESTSLSGTSGRFSGSKYAAFTTTTSEVARATTAVSSDTTKIGYQVGIGGTQAAGTYTTTIILTATPIY